MPIMDEEYYDLMNEEKYDRDDDPFSTPYCTECGQPCTPIKVDCGYGRLDVRGSWVTHHDWQWESDCCGVAVDDSPPEETDDGENDEY